MNKIAKQITAICLCAALCLGGASVAFAKTINKQEQNSTVSETKEKKSVQQEISKDETVYVLAGTDGSVRKIIVSDWLKNTLGSDTVSDQSDLSDIENVKGDEGYTLSGDNMKVWDAQGNDIYYQGNIEKELPVGMSVTYKLDGKTVSADEIAGKSGKVTVRFDYSNSQYEMVEIDGQKEKIYVPFAVLTGMMLDNEVFSNVEVTNGKLINDGDRTVVVGIAFPGLQENLDISSDDITIPNYVEISADAENFELGMTVTIATNEVFNELDVEKISSENLTESLDELTEAMQSLIDGSSALYDGIDTLLDSSDELAAGVDKLAEGTRSLKTGVNTLGSGADQLQAGATELSNGLTTLSSGSDSLNSGAKQVFNSLLSTATAQIKAAGVPVPDLTIENYSDTLDGIIASMGENTASDGAKTIIALKASLDSYNTFYRGLRSYTGGVDSAATGAAALSVGAQSLKDGAAQLEIGATSLYDGMTSLQSSMPSLTDGITQLRDGAKELSDGIKQFDEQGVQKLLNIIDEDLDGVVERLKATVNVSSNYQNFTGIGDDMNGQVKFIYRTDEIK